MKTFRSIIFDCDGVLFDSEILANRVEVEIKDSVVGVRAGRAANMTVCGFLGGSHVHPGHADRLTAASADFLVSSFDELSQILL